MSEHNHDIHHEFPEYREIIIQLKTTDPHFQKLSEDYANLTHEIEKLERAGSAGSDSYMENLKKRRLNLKDDIFHILREQV